MAFVNDYPDVSKVVRACYAVAFISLAIGGLFGLIQGLHRTSLFRGIFSSIDYYTLLTAHGVLLALVFTTFAIAGLFTWGVTRSLDRAPEDLRFTWVWFWTMTVGVILATIAILGGIISQIPFSANVLFTFYAPLKASPIFYIGAALLIVGSWLAGLDWFRSFWAWRGDHPDERIPLQTFMVLTTMLMWYISTIGVAIEVVVFLIPWSLGLIAEVDPLLTRTLFWYFGHPVVYFWLMPAYFAWYTILPKLAGGRLFSDPLARVVFVLFLLLSTPVGFHHQYVDPGIAEGFKFIAMTNTMFLLLPSLLTAFTVIASIEHGARQRGGSGRLNWLRALPWDEPAFVGMALAGLLFAAGGFSGMINAGMNINYLIHNTLWVPGHFHLTVGSAAALTFMSTAYWLYPQISGKRLKYRGLALVQPYLWFIGMTFMSNAMHRAGLAGVPRRTAEPEYQNVVYEGIVGGIGEMRTQIALGAVLLFASLTLFLVVIVATWLGSPGGRLRVNSVFPEPLSGAENSPVVLDNLRLWTAIALLLIALAYGLPIYDLLADGILAPGSPPFPT